MPEENLEQRRSALEKKLKSKTPDITSEPQGTGSSDYGSALRLSSEFVAAIFVGCVLGWGVDKLTGITPIGLILGLLFGFGAGIVNVLRVSGQIAAPGARFDGDKSEKKPYGMPEQ